ALRRAPGLSSFQCCALNLARCLSVSSNNPAKDSLSQLTTLDNGLRVYSECSSPLHHTAT
ncbi:MAG: hypothetical protein MHPSP_003940, partial [Paramarteilia canceri]